MDDYSLAPEELWALISSCLGEENGQKFLKNIYDNQKYLMKQDESLQSVYTKFFDLWSYFEGGKTGAHAGFWAEMIGREKPPCRRII